MSDLSLLVLECDKSLLALESDTNNHKQAPVGSDTRSNRVAQLDTIIWYKDLLVPRNSLLCLVRYAPPTIPLLPNNNTDSSSRFPVQCGVLLVTRATRMQEVPPVKQSLTFLTSSRLTSPHSEQ